MIAFCLTLVGPISIMLLLLAVIFQGVGAGIYDVGINAASVDYERRAPRSVLNAFHACFNAGAVSGRDSDRRFALRRRPVSGDPRRARRRSTA